MRRVAVLILLFLATQVSAQISDEDNSEGRKTPPRKLAEIPPPRPQPRWLLDKPTAWMLPKGSFDVDFRTFPQGGLQSALSIGLARRFSIGVAYGGAGVFSESVPEWNPRIEFLIKYLLSEGNETFPALAVGYSSLGYGLFVKTDSVNGYYEDRYLVKSPGFYVVLSQSYDIYNGNVSFHGGLNYSMENKIDPDPDVFVGMSAGLGYDMEYTAEYDFAINDNKRAGIFGLGRGYLNMGLAWYITSELSLELDFRNLLLNRKEIVDGEKAVIDREIRLIYLQFFSN